MEDNTVEEHFTVAVFLPPKDDNEKHH